MVPNNLFSTQIHIQKSANPKVFRPFSLEAKTASMATDAGAPLTQGILHHTFPIVPVGAHYAGPFAGFATLVSVYWPAPQKT